MKTRTEKEITDKEVIIEVARFSPYKMALVLINKKIVYMGNYWDFHDGCHGKIVAGYNLDGLWSRGIHPLALALSKAIGQTGLQTQVKKKSLTMEEYNQLTNSRVDK